MMRYVMCPVVISANTTVKDCGCDDIFKSVQGNSENESDVKTPALKNISPETLPTTGIEYIATLKMPSTGYHARYQAILPQHNGNSVFHPPAV